MSEVDRLSNSGLYPALPIADRRSSRDDPERRSRSEPRPTTAPPKAAENSETASPRPLKSQIDEYA
jgi:hypothetical protein